MRPKFWNKKLICCLHRKDRSNAKQQKNIPKILFRQPDLFDFPRNENKPISNNQHADDNSKSRHENGWNKLLDKRI